MLHLSTAQMRERNLFSILRFRSTIQTVLWVAPQKTGEEMNPEGHKALDMESHLSGWEPPSLFPHPTVVFHLACETSFLSNISIT